MIVCTVQTKSRVVDERKTITGCIHGVDCRYEDILLTYKKKATTVASYFHLLENRFKLPRWETAIRYKQIKKARWNNVIERVFVKCARTQPEGFPRTRNPIKRPASERNGVQFTFIRRVISLLHVSSFSFHDDGPLLGRSYRLNLCLNPRFSILSFTGQLFY
jgi:hypothetical protein